MALPEVIRVDKNKCQHCLACLLVCPVKLCNIVEPDGISVKADLCIGCGECIRACNAKGHKARSGIDDFDAFEQDIEAGTPVGVLVAPSAAVNYDGVLLNMVTALRNMGVQYVFDVSFGAEIATYLYLKLVRSGAAKPMLAQPCPAVVSFIEIYHSELIPYLAPTHSPALAAAMWVKSQAAYQDLKLAFLGPCLAKRREVHDPDTKGIVSYNITFESLDKYFQKHGVSPETLKPSTFDSPEAERAVVFSQPGGLTETFQRFGVPIKKSDIPRVEGPQEVYLNYLPELKKDILQGRAPVLVDILNCQHGCNIGPAATHCHTHFQVDLIMDQRKEEQIKKHKTSPGANPTLFEEYYNWIEAENLDFSRAYSDKSSNRYLREPSQEEEEKTWTRMHKMTEEERQINCASCGYGNCRGMMLAIVNGLNHVESCKYYLFKENELNLKKVEAQAEEIQKSRDEIAAWNEVLEKTVTQRTMALRNLLNNAGQGFLTFGPDLLVNEEYSYECLKIFRQKIEGLKFSKLIYPQNEEEQNFLNSLAVEIFQQDEDIVQDIYLPLLPKEVVIKNKHIEIEYKIITDDYAGSRVCMAILTDVTDKRQLESQMEREKSTLKMVVKVVVNYSDFIQTVKEYQNFCDIVLDEIMYSSKPWEDILAEIFRYVHTYKGNFSQFNMIGISAKLHDLETQISQYCKNYTSQPGKDDFIQLINESDLRSWLLEDMERLEKVLGPEFLYSDDTLTINKSKLIEIEKKIESILPPAECKILILELRKLRYKSFDSLFGSYHDYIAKLAERYQKSIYPFEIKADQILVDPDQYGDFVRTLVHVFRNAVDHGIETMDERLDIGKEEYGRIRCQISNCDSQIILTIADDGRGIDCAELRNIILQKGLLNSEEIETISDEEVTKYIFEDSFSTKKEVTELSGRGVGLAAVKSEVQKLGGSVNVKSTVGKGTEFIFKIPLENAQTWETVNTTFIKPLTEITKDFLSSHIGLEIQSVESFDVGMPEKLQLNKVTTFITIRGAIEGLFVLSAEEPVLRKMVKKFVLDDLTQEEEAEYMEDVLGECTNTILGNSLKMFPGLREMIVIETPLSLSSKDALVKYPESVALTSRIQTSVGNLSLSLVVPQKFDGINE